MTNPPDRRRSPRVELVGQLHGEMASLDVAIVVREISLGGMSFESPRMFAVGSQHQFLLTLGDGSAVVVMGRIAYSRAAPTPSPAEYVSGVQFNDEDAADPSAAVGGLVQKLT